MSTEQEIDRLAKQMRASFEADVRTRASRASRIKLQHFIPSHWFAAAASECASMYVVGFFYGAISIAQAYVEALSLFLAESHQVRLKKDATEQWRTLHREKIVSLTASDAAVFILADRNNFHHLDKRVEQQYAELEARAEECVNLLHAIESEVFAFSIDKPGMISPRNPRYWPSGGEGLAQVNLRQLW